MANRPIPALGACRSCGAPVYWARTASGAIMPVDAAPSPEGTVLLFVTARGEVTGLTLKKGDPIPEAPRRKSHFATCPQSAEHRQARLKL